MIDHAGSADALLTRASDDIHAAADIGATKLAQAELALKAAHVHAMLAVADQQRIGNKLTVALVDQLSAIAPYLAPMGGSVDPAIKVRQYLSDAEWEGLLL
jgi:hypothetical protein